MKKRKVIRTYPDGMTEEYESVSEAARDVGRITHAVYEACLYGYTCGGSRWRFADGTPHRKRVRHDTRRQGTHRKETRKQKTLKVIEASLAPLAGDRRDVAWAYVIDNLPPKCRVDFLLGVVARLFVKWYVHQREVLISSDAYIATMQGLSRQLQNNKSIM